MKVDHFSLFEKKIMIYAAGSVGRRVLKVCHENDLSMAGFIDERAEEIGVFQDYRVYSLEQIASFEEKEEYAIIITVRNVFEHDTIADRLSRLGFANLIFKPYSVLIRSAEDEDNIIFEAHEMLTERGKVYIEEIPESRSLEKRLIRAAWFIEERNDRIKCYVPSELLFTNEKKETLYNGINLLTCHPVVPLFRAFDAGNAEELERGIDVYVNEFARGGAQNIAINTDGLWEQNVLTGRRKVFSEMAAMQALSDSFFVDFCPEVEWNQNMRLSLISSGKSRACFLIARNMGCVPVWLKKNEWKIFYHEDAVREVRSFLYDNGITVLMAPLPHPAFMNMDHMCYNYKFFWLERTGRFVARYICGKMNKFCFGKYSALYAMEDLGITERFYASQGIKVYRYQRGEELEEYCDRLFYYVPTNYHKDKIDFSFVSMKYRSKLNIILHDTRCFCFLLDDQGIDETSQQIDNAGFKIINTLFTAFWMNKEIRGLILCRKAENE